MSDLKDIYSDLILEESRSTEYRGKLDSLNSLPVRIKNPLCGDALIIYFDIEKDLIKKVRFEGSGCAISMASASVFARMAEGQKINKIQELALQFKDFVIKINESGDQLPEDLKIFEGIKTLPGRQRCAVLAWESAGSIKTVA